MNEQIKQFAKQAEKYADENFRGEPTWSEAFESKFAELIIRECGQVYIQNQQDGVMTLTQDLLQHFGVEA